MLVAAGVAAPIRLPRPPEPAPRPPLKGDGEVEEEALAA